MRVISGKYKKMDLKGFNIEGIRPTMDKVKESVFAMINEYIEDSICLDLFSGSGALGIEALSNGSKYVYFNDKSKDSINIIKYNLNKIKDTNYTVFNEDYINILKKFSNNSTKFDIIFIDPPYGKVLIKDIIKEILKYNILNKNGILVCEYENENLEDNYENLDLIKDRKYGRVYIKIYKSR